MSEEASLSSLEQEVVDQFGQRDLHDLLDEKDFVGSAPHRALLARLYERFVEPGAIDFLNDEVAIVNFMRLIYLSLVDDGDIKLQEVLEGFFRHPSREVAEMAHAFRLASEDPKVKYLRGMKRDYEFARTGKLPPFWDPSSAEST